MMYLWPTASSMTNYPPEFGVMTAPAMGSVAIGITEGRSWACDNEAFTVGFKPERMFPFLDILQPWRATCLFIVCPDVVGDAAATLALYRTWAPEIKRYGPVAFVAQDGQEHYPLPVAFDWLFVGGSTHWKLGPGAESCIRQAQHIGKPVHVGRINSLKRWQHFSSLGAQSCDGTFPTREPDTARRRFFGIAAYNARNPFLHGLIPGSDSSG